MSDIVATIQLTKKDIKTCKIYGVAFIVALTTVFILDIVAFTQDELMSSIASFIFVVLLSASCLIYALHYKKKYLKVAAN